MDIVKKATKPILTNSTTDWVSFKIKLDANIVFPVAINSIDDLEHASENFIKITQNAGANT